MRSEILLWDHDGVLVDTEPRYFEATRLALGQWGVRLTWRQWLAGQAEGLRLDQFGFPATARPLDYAAIRARRDEIYMGFLATEDVRIEGAEEVLGILARRHRMGLVTTSSWQVLRQIHSGNALLGHFEHIVTAADCVQVKPHPEPYLRALELFGAAPGEAVAVEDSERGLRSAVSAGIRCLVVRSAFMCDAAFAGAEAVLTSIREVPGTLAG